ncbi:MAG: glutamyl-tRNA reductase [Dehalococcoidia bacterium]
MGTQIITLGLSYKTTPVELREKLHVAVEDLPQLLDILGRGSTVLERMMLSTCNRIEAYAVVEEPEAAKEHIVRTLAAYGKLSGAAFEDRLYVYTDARAMRHLFRVAASLDSMVVGEPQILGQVKQAYEIAREAGATGAVLNHLLERALSVGKRVRTETGIAQAACSVPSAAVELAEKIFGDLTSRPVLILGAGKMAEVAARHLAKRTKHIAVANRSFERAQELARRLAGRAVRFEEVNRELLHADVVLSSTGASHYLLSRGAVETVMGSRRNRPIFLIDIAVPRNIDPGVNQLDNVYLYDIDDLAKVVRTNRQERQKEAERAETMVEKEVGRFLVWLRNREMAPTIISLREKIEAIRAVELTKALNRLGRLSPEDRATVETLTTSLVNKILHTPVAALKRQSVSDTGHQYVQVLQWLFGLDEAPTR